MNENVEVRFGGHTGDLDAASTKAAADIRKVSTQAAASQGAFARLKSGFTNFTTGFKKGWSEAGAEQAKARAGIEAFGATATNVFSSANGGISGVVSSFGRLGVAAGVAVVAIGAVYAVVKLLDFGEPFGDAAEKLDQMSQKLGMSATEVSRWGALATTAGMSVDAFASSATKLERTMVAAANGGQKQIAMFRELGVSMETLKQGVTPTLMAMADGMAEMENGPKKTAIAIGLMSRAGATMIPILNGGSDAIKEQMQIAEDYGAVVSEEFMASGLAVDDAMDTMTLASKGLKDMLFEALAPAVVGTAEGFLELSREMMASYRSGGAVYIILQTIAGAFKVVITILDAVQAGFQALWYTARAALQGIYGAVVSVGGALAKLLSGDFSSIGATFRAGMAGTGRAIASEMGQASGALDRFASRTHRMWTGSNVRGVAGDPGGGGDLDLDMPGSGGGSRARSRGDGGAASRKAAEDRLKAELEVLDARMAAIQDDYAAEMALQDEKLAKLKAFYGEDSSEYIRELRQKQSMERHHAADVVKLTQERLKHVASLESAAQETETNLGNISLEQDRARFAARDAMGMVSNDDRISALQKFSDRETDLAVTHENAIYQIKVRSMQAQLAVAGLPLDEQRRINSELELMAVEHEGRMLELRRQAVANTAGINDTAAMQTQEKWKGIVDPIAGAFQNLLTGLATNSQSLGQALLAIGDQIVTSLIQMGIKAASQWAVMELMKTSATTVGVATRTAAEASGAVAGTAISAGAAIKQIAHKAAVAAAGAYSAIAAIPVVGPFLAPAAAAAALFAVYKLGSSIFSAEGGEGEVANDGAMYQLHKQEMVLPAKFANPLRSMLMGPQTSGLASNAAAAGFSARSAAGMRGGDNSFHYNPQHTNMNADMSELLRRDGRVLRKWFMGEVRDGRLRMPTS